MPPDPIVLGFDTSAAHCAAALLVDGRIAATRQEDMGRGQAERLIPLLEDVLAEADLGWRDLGLIGVGVGPGNFTGIRISVAAARGLALSLGIRAIGVSVLEAQAHGQDGVTISAVAGPRDTVYAQIFGAERATSPVVGSPEDLALAVPEGSHPLCVGAARDVFARRFAGSVATAPEAIAPAIARIAFERRGDRSIPRPAPLYLRPADAAPSRDAPPVILS